MFDVNFPTAEPVVVAVLLSLCLPVCMSMSPCLPVCMSMSPCLPVCMSMSPCQPVCMSLLPCVYTYIHSGFSVCHTYATYIDIPVQFIALKVGL